MPNLTIAISDEAWPTVVAVLIGRHGPPPQGATVTTWASGIAADIFKASLAEAMEPPPEPPPRPRRRIRIRGT